MGRSVAHNGTKGSTLGDAEMMGALRRTFRTPMEAFRAFDTNLDGTIDRAEFEIGLNAVSAPRIPCAGTVARLFNQADVDEWASFRWAACVTYSVCTDRACFVFCELKSRFSEAAHVTLVSRETGK